MDTLRLNIARIEMSLGFNHPVIVLGPKGSGKYFAASEAIINSKEKYFQLSMKAIKVQERIHDSELIPNLDAYAEVTPKGFMRASEALSFMQKIKLDLENNSDKILLITEFEYTDPQWLCIILERMLFRKTKMIMVGEPTDNTHYPFLFNRAVVIRM